MQFSRNAVTDRSVRSVHFSGTVARLLAGAALTGALVIGTAGVAAADGGETVSSQAVSSEAAGIGVDTRLGLELDLEVGLPLGGLPIGLPGPDDEDWG